MERIHPSHRRSDAARRRCAEATQYARLRLRSHTPGRKRRDRSRHARLSAGTGEDGAIWPHGRLTMNEADVESAIRLDGNVAAGLLAEVFRCESTTAITVCSGCGAIAPLGSLLAYGLDMGAVLRCPTCD